MKNYIDRITDIKDFAHAFARGSSSVVELYLAKVVVAGSNPVSRSIFFMPEIIIFGDIAKR